MAGKSLRQRALYAAEHINIHRAELVMVLADIRERRDYFPSASFRDFVEEELGMTAREGSEYARVGGRLRKLPGLRAAFEKGTLSWSKIREVVRVASPATEERWLEELGRLTAREVASTVARMDEGEEPPYPDDPVAPRARQVRIVIECEASDADLILGAIEVHRRRMGETEDATARDKGVILADMARTTLALEAERPESDLGKNVCQVNIMACPTCRTSTHVGQHSPTRVSDAAREEVACCAAEVDLTEGSEQGKLTSAVPQRIQRLVRGRADFVCEVPGCTHRLWTHIHHIQPRAAGGRHDPENLALVCRLHHVWIHEGFLTLERTAVGGVRVEKDFPEPLCSESTEGVLLGWLHYQAVTIDDLTRAFHVDKTAMRRELGRLEVLGKVRQMTSGEWVATS